MPRAWHVAGHRCFRQSVIFSASPARVGGVSYDFCRRCYGGIWGRPRQPVGEAKGKRLLEHRDARFASASLYVLPTPDQPLSSAGSCEESQAVYAPAYFVGSWTVSRLRPFLRRRLRTSRPHLVAIRNLKPCVRMRRLLRGR